MTRTTNLAASFRHTPDTFEALLRDLFGPGHSFRSLPAEEPFRPFPVVMVGGALLYPNNDVIEAIVSPHEHGFSVGDGSDGWFLAQTRRAPALDPERAAAIATAWGVDFDTDSILADCTEHDLVATAYRVMLASRALTIDLDAPAP